MRFRQRWDALRFDRDDVRLMITCLFGGILLAVMTGPEGVISNPLWSFRESIFSSHIWGFLIFGILIGALSLYRRKVRMGVVVSSRPIKRRSIRETVSAIIASSEWKARGATTIVAFIVTLLVADFTGPFVPNKLSVHELWLQLGYSRTYGYFIIAFWLLNTIRLGALPRKEEPSIPVLFRSPVTKIVAGGIGGLVFAFCADPWLPVRFSFSYFTASGTSDNAFFAHWTTYLWTIAGLLVGMRAVWAEREAKADINRRWKRPHMSVSSDTRFALYGGALFIAVEAPKFISPFWQDALFQQIGIFCFLAVGLNVVIGFAGLLDLGYVAFYALGAYTNAYLTGALPIHPPFLLNAFYSIPIAIVVAMIAGVLLGLPTLRLRGDYLAIVTLGFGEIVYVLASNLTNITDGAGGTGPAGSFSMNFWFAHFSLNGQAIPDDLNFYYLLLAFLVPILFLFNSLNHSKVGRSWAAIREDEDAAASLGINGLKYKVMAFAIGASTSGVAGVFGSAKLGALFPSDFALQVSITVVVLVIFGGMGSISGVLLGSAFVGWILEYLIFHSFIDYNQADKFMYFGAILVLTMIFRPQGMLPARRRAREFRDAEAGLGSAFPNQRFAEQSNSIGGANQ